jgi:hypothetical protein
MLTPESGAGKKRRRRKRKGGATQAESALPEEPADDGDAA